MFSEIIAVDCLSAAHAKLASDQSGRSEVQDIVCGGWSRLGSDQRNTFIWREIAQEHGGYHLLEWPFRVTVRPADIDNAQRKNRVNKALDLLIDNALRAMGRNRRKS